MSHYELVGKLRCRGVTQVEAKGKMQAVCVWRGGEKGCRGMSVDAIRILVL